MDLIIRGGSVVSHTGIFRADVGVSEGRVCELLPPGAVAAAATVVDAAGLYVLPGMVDAHVHLRTPGFPQKETIATGTAAAACGGVTAVLDMPDTLPPVTTAALLQAKAELTAGQAYVDVGFYALLYSGVIDKLSELAAAGCMGFKLFLGPTTGNLPAPGWGELLAAGTELARQGLPLIVHAENREVVEYWEQRARRQGDTYHDFLAARPAFGEAAATADACLLAAHTGAHVHIAHVALNEAVHIIKEARMKGRPISAETCPPYLFLTADSYARAANAMKVLPPVRAAADQRCLWAGLCNGTLDIVATDHAPHTAADKSGSIWEAASGAPGVETMLPLMLSATVDGKCTLPDVVRWCSYQPARLFGLHGKGAIAPGYDADIVLVDMKAQWRFQPEKLHSLGVCTPFADWSGHGRLRQVYFRGQLIAEDGELTGAAPAGRVLRPENASARATSTV